MHGGQHFFDQTARLCDDIGAGGGDRARDELRDAGRAVGGQRLGPVRFWHHIGPQPVPGQRLGRRRPDRRLDRALLSARGNKAMAEAAAKGRGETNE